MRNHLLQLGSLCSVHQALMTSFRPMVKQMAMDKSGDSKTKEINMKEIFVGRTNGGEMREGRK